MAASPDLSGLSWDHISNHVADYLFEQHAHLAKVRHITPWLGFVLYGIRARGVEVRRIPRQKELMFELSATDTCYKVTYNHKAGERGGLDIWEVESLKNGAPEIRRVTQITSPDQAEAFYLACRAGRWPDGWRK